MTDSHPTRKMAARAGLWMAAMLCSGLTAQQPGPAAAAGSTAMRPAVLNVSGDVPTPLMLSADDLAKMPRETVSIPAPNGTKSDYEGVPMREILKRAGAPIGKLRGKALASYVLAKARDGYQVAFTLGEIDPEFGNATIVIADQLDGKPMADSQGPFRLVCPADKAGARSVRMLTSLDIVGPQK